MVKYKLNRADSTSAAKLDMTFKALSDSTRRAIIGRLSGGDALVTELAKPFDMSLPAVSKHLGILEKAGLIKREKDGRIRRCHLNAGPLKNAAEWIDYYKQFWESRFDALENSNDPTVKVTMNIIAAVIVLLCCICFQRFHGRW